MRVTKNQDVRSEKGFVLVGSLVIISLIALVASITFITTFTDIKISSNYKTSIQSFYIAEAGVQRAKAELRTVSFDEVLDGTYGGSPGILSFGTNVNFMPLPNEEYGKYNVEVKDDNDGDPTTVNIIGTGFLPNGSKSSVELKIQKTPIPFPPIPAAITIIGEANVYIYNSNEIYVDGNDWKLDDEGAPTGLEDPKYAIALSNIVQQDPYVALQYLADAIIQEHNFVGTSTSTGHTESIGRDDNMTSQDLQDFVDMAKQVADNSLMLSDISDGLPTIDFGSVEDPKITYFNMKPEDNDEQAADLVFGGDITGSGILIVEGNDLIFNNTLNWIGLVIVIGNDVGGGFLGDDTLEQSITGAFIVDEQETDEHNELVLEGNVNVLYSSEAVEIAQRCVLDKGIGNITMLAWRQLMN